MATATSAHLSAPIIRRNRPGTKAEAMYSWPDEPFEEMDSTLAVQQYIQQLIKADHEDIGFILEPPEGQDEGVWKYEHLRQFCLQLNDLAVMLQVDCNPNVCTQMTATEQWIFLCAAHKTPKECPALDYTRHTLDGAASLLNSNKYFPSRYERCGAGEPLRYKIALEDIKSFIELYCLINHKPMDGPLS